MAADDDELLAEVAHALGPDPVPDHVLAAARAALGWRTLDAELAALLEEASLTGVRSDGPSPVAFTVGEVRIELELVADPPRVSGFVSGLDPTEGVRAELRLAAGSVLAGELDEFGLFEIELAGPPAGPVSLRLRPAEGPAITTDWAVL